MDETQFQRWLGDYVEAWRTYEREAIERLFSEDAAYRYHPWDEPLVGRAAIADNWLSDRDEPGSWTAEYEPFAIDGDRAVAVGVTRYLADGREYHNVFLCRFDGSARCREFTEIFLKRG